MLRFPKETIGKLRAFLEEADPATVTSSRAAELVQGFVELERLAGAGRVLFAGRASSSRTWAEEGHRFFASWLAEVQKSSLSEAFSALDTSRRLEDLEETAGALRKGEISPAQANVITEAAKKAPSAEAELLDAASTETMKQLKARSRKILSSSPSEEDELERYNRIRRSRYLRHFTDHDGAFRLEARLAPDDGARVLCAISKEADRIFEVNRKNDTHEDQGACRADALVGLLGRGGAGGKPSNSVVVRIDASALRRGHKEGSETCEIQGVGPVPVATVRRMLPSAFVKLLVTDSVDVLSVCHVGRTVPAHVQSALEERDLACVVPGCDVSLGLETHHFKVDYARCRTTSLDGLCRVCKAHHDMITYEGFALVGGPGRWELHPPKSRQFHDTG
jgi:Domain of unknown function (DUF222)